MWPVCTEFHGESCTVTLNGATRIWTCALQSLLLIGVRNPAAYTLSDAEQRLRVEFVVFFHAT